MKGLAFAAVAALTLGLGIVADVQAADAAKIRVTETQRVAASPAQVWATVGSFGDLRWHPAVKSVTASAGDVPGSIRRIDLGGPVLTEQLWSYDAAARRLTYRIMDTPENQKILPVKDYESTLTVTRDGAGALVRWSSVFQPLGGDAAAVEKAIRGVYRAGLDGLPQLATPPKR